MAETATEITAAGYANLQIGQGCAAWAYIEFQTDTDAKIMRIAKTDSRVAAASGYPTDKKMRYVVSLTGADTDVAAFMAAHSGAVTFAKALFRNTDSDTADILASDAFTAATLSTASDTLTVTIEAGVGAGE